MRTLLLLSALLLAVPASAQLSGGVRGGLNVASFSGADAPGTEARLGAVGGAFVRYDVTPAVALQVEALYSQEGAEDPDNFGTYKLDYVDVPVLLRLGVPVSRFADAGVYIGPSLGVPVGAEFEYDDGVEEDEEAAFGVGVTVGADYWAGPFGIDLRYTAGLSDALSDEIDGEPVPTLDLRNQAFTVTLGLRFGAPERDLPPRRRPRRPY